ncbi:glyoxalase [Acidihalobacter yilgarnensis]|uniref:Glyoxalase n=1 Tax=Acidihalobacter yilgarnensis TaxID=2819280 RepID=A0A1D8ILD0_9GAMM|nr:VOC family protein [Acidihalobacter yilgarnensis]AOU97289.1 glyoxalase [Acidihalobacter yilgarnensis]
MYIPPSFNTVTPYFFVKDADQFITFLVEAFGGTEVLRSLRPDGRIANAQVRIGTSMIMASEASGRYAPMPTACYIYVDDADNAMVQALAAGGALEMEVSDMPYGDRQGGIKDPFGNIWWISQRVVKAPYAT